MNLPNARRAAIVALWVASLPSWAGCSDSGSSGQPDPTQNVCGPGSMLQVDGTCIAVGPAAQGMPPVFAPSPDGWGYGAVAATACSGNEYAVLGSPSCKAVDDCSAPFPPASATLVVSATLTGPNVVATIAAALQQAAAGDTIAFDAGIYPSVSLTTDVTLIGRCASTTTLGDGVHNAVYVDGAKVGLQSLTLSSSASPIAVAQGSVTAERLIVRNSDVAVAAVGSGSSATLTDSLVVGLSSDSLGGMAAQGGHIVVQSSEIRAVTNGLLAADAGSKVDVRRSIVSVIDSSTSSGLEASANGTLTADGVWVRSVAARLAAVHADVGTVGSTPASGTMTIQSSVLEQQGAELTSAPAVAVVDGGQLTLTDTTVRHQALIGVDADGARTVTLTRVAVLGSPVPAVLRTAAFFGAGVNATALALAVPWAQGVGVMVDESQLDLTGSLIANVTRRDQGEEAILVSGGKVTVSACELAANQQFGIVAIGGATVGVDTSVIHDGTSADGSPFSGALISHSAAVFDGCYFARNGEGIMAAGSAVVATNTVFRSHHVALRAMDGMQLLENTADLTDNALAFQSCQFVDDDVQTSTDTVPDLNAPPFPDAGLGQ